MKAKILKSTGISLIILTALSVFTVMAWAQQPWKAKPKTSNQVSQQQTVKKRVLKKTAQPPSTNQPIMVKPYEPDSSVKFGADLSVRYSAQPEEPAGQSRREYLYYEFIPAISTEDYRFRAIFGFTDNFKTPGNTEWENTAFEFRKNKPWDLGDYFQLQPELLAQVPLFQRGSDFNGAAGGRLNLIANSKNWGLPDLIFKYGFQAMKMFYKQENSGTEADPNYNTDIRLRSRVHLGYQLTPWLLAMTYFHIDSNFYYDNYLKNNFYHETFLELTPLSFLLIDVGVTNGGGVYKGDNQDQDNVRFYDGDSTDIFVAVGVSF